jgi:hypothetical protein
MKNDSIVNPGDLVVMVNPWKNCLIRKGDIATVVRVYKKPFDSTWNISAQFRDQLMYLTFNDVRVVKDLTRLQRIIHGIK